MNTSQIAKVLNDENIDTPMEYIVKNNKSKRTKWGNKNEIVFWANYHVWKILKDERYTGKLIANRIERVKIGSSKFKKVDEDKWIKIPNSFEKIVTEE